LTKKLTNVVDTPHELFARTRTYCLVIVGVSLIVSGFVIGSARKLIKINHRTGTDNLRGGAGYGAAYTSALNNNA
jgi:hypothetical protein